MSVEILPESAGVNDGRETSSSEQSVMTTGASPFVITVVASGGESSNVKSSGEVQDESTISCGPVAVVNGSKHTATSEDKRRKIFSVMKTFQQQHLSAMVDDSISKTDDIESCEQPNFCRICHSFGDEVLVTPCQCTGSAKFVHASCLLTWFVKSVKDTCELCQKKVGINRKMKKFAEWRRPEEKPFSVIWFSIFLLGLLLNVFSIIFNSIEKCMSTTCLVFYFVNIIGVILDLLFLSLWFRACTSFFAKWLALNQVWTLKESHVPGNASSLANHVNEAPPAVVETVYEDLESI